MGTSERPKPKFSRYRNSRNVGIGPADNDTETEMSWHTDTETDNFRSLMGTLSPRSLKRGRFNIKSRPH